MPINWKVTKEDFDLLDLLADRAVASKVYTDRREALMDLQATHANGNPLRLADMLAASGTFDLVHDFAGIRRHLNRETGKLEGFFSPRFSRWPRTNEVHNGMDIIDSRDGCAARDDGTHYDVFTRTWWKLNPAWPNGLEPCPGRKHYIARRLTYSEARAMCDRWNETHNPGRLSRKAEFEER